jgi:hypothetical protein
MYQEKSGSPGLKGEPAHYCTPLVLNFGSAEKNQTFLMKENLENEKFFSGACL